MKNREAIHEALVEKLLELYFSDGEEVNGIFVYCSSDIECAKKDAEEILDMLDEVESIEKSDAEQIKEFVVHHGYDAVIKWIGDNRPLGLNIMTRLS